MDYIITYTNHFKIADAVFSFRRKELFDITNVPILKNQISVSGCNGYWLSGKFYSLSKLKDLVLLEPKEVDVSALQWFVQENLNYVFNL